MRNTAYQLIVAPGADRPGAEVVQPIAAGRTEPVRLKARPGATYVLRDTATDKAPQQIYARRRGKDLLLTLDPEHTDSLGKLEPDVVLEGYYDAPGGQVVGPAEDGSSYNFIPHTAEPQDQIALLTDGAQFTQVLGGLPLLPAAAASPLVAAAPAGLGLGTVGAAGAGLALAAAGGGGGGGTPPPVALSAALASGEDTGASATDGITQNNQPLFEGSTSAGNRVTVTLGNGTAQDITVNGDGTWRWQPPQALSDQAYTVSFTAVEPSGRSTTRTLTFTVDTQGPAATLASNAAALDTHPATPDQVLNIRESAKGVVLTITLSEAPARPLALGDLVATGGTLDTTSFKQESDTVYTVTAQPSANAKGTLVLGWSAAGKALTDAAGNLLTGTAATVSVAYDTQAPQVRFANAASVIDLPAGNGNLSIGWTLEGDGEFASVSAGLLGMTASSLTNKPLELDGSKLAQLAEGYYTLSLGLTDPVGNTSQALPLLRVDRGTLQADTWKAADAAPTPGTADNELFINRSGNHTFTGGGGKDTFVWLARDADAQGALQRDVITDFTLGNVSSNGQADVLKLTDLLGQGSRGSLTDLGRYLQLREADLNGNGVRDLELLISSQGNLASSIASNSTGNADQVIGLLDVGTAATTTTLQTLAAQGNLIWQSDPAVSLAVL